MDVHVRCMSPRVMYIAFSLQVPYIFSYKYVHCGRPCYKHSTFSPHSQGTRSLVYFYQEDPPRDLPHGAGFSGCSKYFGTYFEWNFSSAPETDCTARCGEGWRIKRAVCVLKGSTTRGNFCCGLPPVMAQKCQRDACKPKYVHTYAVCMH